MFPIHMGLVWIILLLEISSTHVTQSLGNSDFQCLGGGGGGVGEGEDGAREEGKYISGLLDYNTGHDIAEAGPSDLHAALSCSHH